MPQRFNLRVDSCEYAANEGLNEKTKLLSKKACFPSFLDRVGVEAWNN